MPEFVDYFQKCAYNDLGYESHSPRQWLCEKLTQLLDTIAKCDKSAVKNQSIREWVEKKFDKVVQHDCHEFILHFLSELQD